MNPIDFWYRVRICPKRESSFKETLLSKWSSLVTRSRGSERGACAGPAWVQRGSSVGPVWVHVGTRPAVDRSGFFGRARWGLRFSHWVEVVYYPALGFAHASCRVTGYAYVAGICTCSWDMCIHCARSLHATYNTNTLLQIPPSQLRNHYGIITEHH